MADICVVDLGFGDGGKGTVVDYLARQNPDATVVRFSGGAQAAHNVVTSDGLHHTFAQFGSGTLAGNRTHLSAWMMVNPMNMLHEARHLAVHSQQWDVFDRLTVSPDALVTTRLHMAWNRIEEISRKGLAHGSCGQGVGATMEYALHRHRRGPHPQMGPLRTGDLRSPSVTRPILEALRVHYLERLSRTLLVASSDEALDTLEYERDMLRNLDLDRATEEYEVWSQIVEYRDDHELTGDLIFEGAQGIGLDETYGTAPHNTWSNCTPQNAMRILDGLGRDRAKVIGVTRTYQTRHGAGPLPTESRSLDRPEPHNAAGTYQGGWRVGHLDCGLLTYTLGVCKGASRIDELAVTHLDALDDHNVVSIGYKPTLGGGFGTKSLEGLHLYEGVYQTWPRDTFVEQLEGTLNRPVTIGSYGPTAEDKKERCASTP